MNTSLEALDCNFVNLDSPTTKQIIAAFCILDGVPDFKLLAARIEQMVADFPRLQQKPRPGFDGYYWQCEEKFDLTKHWFIRQVESSDVLDLKRTAEELLSNGFDFSIPPWRFAFIQGLGKTVAFLMIHHCLADGLGGYELLNALCDKKTIDKTKSQAVQHRHPLSKKLIFTDYCKAYLPILTELFRSRTNSPINGRNSNLRHILTFTFTLSEFKTCKATLKCSLNQLFLSLVCNSLTRYFAQKNVTPSSIRPIIPVNMRLHVNRYTLGNHLTGVAVELPLIPNSILEQVQVIKSRWDKIEAKRLYGFYGLLGKLNSYLPRAWQIKLCQVFAKKTSFICTNIPGPHEQQFLAGAPIVATYGLPALMYGHGLGFSLLTYNHHAHLAVVIDPQVITDENILKQCIIDTQAELVDQQNQ
ncbi:MAG: DUF1298 domain-containing protein [Deltaproteobacteria bacterium]|nr:DUF1298 domain-containing protein [Deltaproteobacteria bacterium]